MSTSVLMFGWELPPDNTGGLGVACAGLTKALSLQKTNINFILPRPYRHTVDYMQVHSPGSSSNTTASLSPSVQQKLNSLLSSPYLSPEQYQQLLKSHPELAHLSRFPYGPTLIAETSKYGRQAHFWAKHLSHDVIHTHDWLTFPAGINAAKISGKPLVTHVHATEFDRTGGQHGHPAVEAIEANGLTQADHIITVSHHTKHRIVHTYGIPDRKISVVHNGIDPQPLSSIPSTSSSLSLRAEGLNPKPSFLTSYQLVLFVGRLTIQKGADYLLHAAIQILKHQPRTVFIIAGTGDMRQQLIMQAAWLGIGDRVLFPGFLRGQQLDNLYRAADLFVMPSVSEPFGLVALEAMQSGTPVIVSRQSGVSEIIKHAFKVDFWDTERLANLIISILKYPTLQNEMSRHARREVNHITWDAAAAKTLAVYQQLMC